MTGRSGAMSRAARLVIDRWLPATIDREAVQVTAAAALANAGPFGQVREIASLLGLGLRLRSRSATGDRPRTIVGQGVIIGLVAIAALACGALLGLSLAAVQILAVAVPALALGISWFDPRLAVAAATVWALRLVATDHVEFVGDLERLGSDVTVSGLVVRWLAMASGVLAAIVIARLAIRRAELV